MTAWLYPWLVVGPQPVVVPADINRFPARSVCWTQEGRYRDRCARLDDLSRVCPAPVVKEWLARAEWEYHYWQYLSRAHDDTAAWVGAWAPPEYWLRRLHDHVGAPAYRQGWRPALIE